jgi:hypothetical protein
MSLLRTLLILIIFYYVIQIFIRYIIPALFGRPTDGNRNEFVHNQKKEQKKAARHEGEVTIDYDPDRKAGRHAGKGDYVDYEEIKD